MLLPPQRMIKGSATVCTERVGVAVVVGLTGGWGCGIGSNAIAHSPRWLVVTVTVFVWCATPQSKHACSSCQIAPTRRRSTRRVLPPSAVRAAARCCTVIVNGTWVSTIVCPEPVNAATCHWRALNMPSAVAIVVHAKEVKCTVAASTIAPAGKTSCS